MSCCTGDKVLRQSNEDNICVSIFGYNGPADKFNVRLSSYEWHILRTEFQQRLHRPPGYVVEIMDTDGDEYYLDLHGISCLWKRSPAYQF